MSESDIVRARVRKLINSVIRPAIYGERCELEVWARRLPGEPIDVQEAISGPFEPFSVGQGWGGAWATTWFHFSGTVPTAWAGNEVRARIDLGFHGGAGFGGEALVWRSGEPAGAINPRHRDLPVAAPAMGGEEVDFHLEAAANPFHDWNALSWPMLMPDYDGPSLYLLQRAELAVVRSDVERAWHDLRVLFELASALDQGDRRAMQIMGVLDRVCSAVDLDDVQGSLTEAATLWRPLLEATGPARAHEVVATGHAHIDTAWLWPLRETPRKCARTFSTALALMDEYPEYRFACSQAQQHAWMKQRYPGLFERMRKAAAEGRFEPTGSMWVEPDTNLTGGESLVRQLVVGKRFFLDNYGIETVDLWLPDAFGYSGALPQILRQAGVRFFLTQKLSWNEIDRFPHHTFWWEGIDGSRVLAHCPPTDTYNGDFSAGQLVAGERAFAQHSSSSYSLYAFGWGDGGGGPTREMLESARRMADLDGLPRIRHGGPRSFFEALEAEASGPESPSGRHGLPVWTGELYFERHRATYTTQVENKRGNRESESLLRQAELWSAVAANNELTGGPFGYPVAELDSLWKTVLLHQFHDILPGSSIHWVHADSRAAYGEVRRGAEELIGRALAALAPAIATGSRVGDGGGRGGPGGGVQHSVIVWNAASFPRRDVVELAVRDAPGSRLVAVDADGAATAVQLLADGRAIFNAEVPGLGWARYEIKGLEPAERALDGDTAPAIADTDGDDIVLDNGLLRLTIDHRGLVTSLVDLESGRQVLEAGSSGNLFQLHPDLPNDTDAWDVDIGYADRAEDLTSGLEAISLTEAGPVRVACRTVRRFRSSTIVQEIRLAAGARLVEFATEVDWHEDHRFLKVAFPVRVHAAGADYEIQFGHISRPTHANTTWDVARFEVAAQRWAHLQESGYGVALINDCKHGYDIRGNVMRLSLIRAPGWPDPTADRGRSRFSYALAPHAGDLRAGRVVEQAECFNIPLRATAAASRDAGGETSLLPPVASAVSCGPQGVGVSAVKQADTGDGLIVRFYEAYGGRGPVRLDARLAAGGTIVSAQRTDLLERWLEGDCDLADGVVDFELRPFELVTLRFATAPTGRRGAHE